MEFAIGFCILDHAFAFFVDNTSGFVFFTLSTMEVIMIHEIITCIVRWVDIYHLYLTHIRVLEQFQHFEVIALDIEVLCGVPVDAFLRTGAQGLAAGLHRLTLCSTLAHPSKVIDLWLSVSHKVAQQFA